MNGKIGFVAILIVVLVSGTALAQSKGPQGPDVTVVNPPSKPVPVTIQGTASFSGNVAVTNTPNVNVVNTPNVNANVVNTANVNVTNTPTVKNIDEPGRLPYQHMLAFDTSTPSCSLNFCLLSLPAVPAGKRLVIEHITAMIFAGISSTGICLLAFGDGTTTNSGNVAIVQPLATKVDLGLGSSTFVIDRPVRVYYESGSVPKVKVAVTESFDTPTSNLSVHGYLIDNN